MKTCNWRNLTKSFFKLTIVHALYTFAGACLFLYLEECLPGEKKEVVNERFLTFLDKTEGLSENEKKRIINVTARFFERIPLSCSFDWPIVTKWWIFTLVTASTIGYGHTTPKTTWGRLSVIAFAFLGIPIAMALFAAAGTLINFGIDKLLIKIEVQYFKRPKVKSKGIKRFILSLLMVQIDLTVAILYSMKFGNLSFVDSLYLSFQTLTTIGYGDVIFDAQLHITTFVFSLLFSSFGMGLVASVISSIVSLMQRPVKRGKILFSKRSWTPTHVHSNTQQGIANGGPDHSSGDIRMQIYDCENKFD